MQFTTNGGSRVVSRFLSSRFHPKSRRLFSFYFSNIMLRTDLVTFGVAFGIAGGMRRLSAYFDNPAKFMPWLNLNGVKNCERCKM